LAAPNNTLIGNTTLVLSNHFWFLST